MKHSLPSLLRTGGLLGIAAFALGAWSVGTANASATRVAPALTGPIHLLQAGAIRPDTCGKTVTYVIHTSGGIFKIPPCGGTAGRVTYGPNNAPAGAKVMLTSNTTNPAPSVCGSTAGETALAYVTATSTGTGSITYGNAKKASSLQVPQIPAGTPLSLFAYAFGSLQFSQSLGNVPKSQKVKFPSPLNGKTVPLGITLCFELDTP